VWAAFALSVRAISGSGLKPADVALLRFGVPALIFLPLLPTRWRAIVRMTPTHAVLILLGAGLPFFFAASYGGSKSSAAYVGTLISGTVPIFVALITVLVYRRGPGRRGYLGVALVAMGAVALLWKSLTAFDSGMLVGAAVLIGASLLWAIYTLCLRSISLDAIGCTILLSVPSFLILVALVFSGAVPSNLAHVTLHQVLPFLVAQGLGVGVVASLAYRHAIGSIGADRSSMLGSLSPVVAALAAVPLLGERIETFTLAGIALITAGVICASAPKAKAVDACTDALEAKAVDACTDALEARAVDACTDALEARAVDACTDAPRVKDVAARHA
jgi:drug/metabolite transporter (DMT)-like permease